MVRIYDRNNLPGDVELNNIVKFLFLHLGEYGDPAYDIDKAARYVLDKNKPGGVIITVQDMDNLIGAVVVNSTGMKGYIPENILVYIATHADHRGKGIGKSLMQTAIEHCDGDIALHVEPDNTAKVLYEKLGFTNKYLEMRLKK